MSHGVCHPGLLASIIHTRCPGTDNPMPASIIALVPSVAKCRVLSVLLSLPDQYPGKQTHPPPDIGECLRLIGLWWWVGVCEVASCCHVTREKQIDTGLVTCVTPGVITTVTSKQRPRPLITLKRPDLWPWRPIQEQRTSFLLIFSKMDGNSMDGS